MNKKHDQNIPFPPFVIGFDGPLNSMTSFDPIGSYTGRTPDWDEIPVQDADDL